MDKKFAELVTKLNSLLFAATLLEREPGESLDDEFVALQILYADILNAYNGNEISIRQRDALTAMYHEVAEVYHRAMD